jgi:hypothetical protein
MESFMTYKGKVQNGTIQVEDGVHLPEGADVQIEVIDVAEGTVTQQAEPTVWHKLSELARWSEAQPCNLPSDLATNHDHYLHGSAKRE